MYLNIGTLNNHHFSFGTNGKVVVLGVPILKHFRVFRFFNAGMCLEDADGTAKRADLDQTAPPNQDLQCLLRLICPNS